MAEESEPTSVKAEELPDYYDALMGLLSQVHLNEETKQIILRNYRARPQEFESSAWRMMNYLTALGVRDTIARFLASRFWSITKNLDLDVFQNLISPQQVNPYASGGMAFPPSSQTVPQQYPMPVQQVDDADMKMMRMMMMMKMMNQPAQSSTDPMQQMMQMMMLSGGRAGVSVEPAYASNGQPIVDSQGNQIMRYTMNPAMQMPTPQQTQEPIIEVFKEIIRGQNDQKRASDERYFKTLEKQREIESEISEKETRALRRRLALIEQEKSSDRFIEDLEKFRRLGLFPTGASSPQSLEAIKLQTDLDRWKYERETDMHRWQTSQEMEARKWWKEKEIEEERERRNQERLGLLTDGLQTTLKEVVTPVLSSMTAGMMSNTPTAASEPEQPNLAAYDDQTLMSQYQEVSQIGSRALEAKKLLELEMQKRIDEKQVKEPARQAAPLKAEQPAPKVDLSGMADLDFEPSFDEDDSEYEDDEVENETLDLEDDEKTDAYDIEY